MKIYLLFVITFLLSLAITSCHSDSVKTEQIDSLASFLLDKEKTTDTSKKVIPIADNKVADDTKKVMVNETEQITVQGTPSNTTPDPQKFFLNIYSRLQKNDSINWSNEFIDKIKSSMKTNHEEGKNFLVWKNELEGFVTKNTGGDPRKVIITTQEQGIIMQGGKKRMIFSAVIENGAWKISER